MTLIEISLLLVAAASVMVLWFLIPALSAVKKAAQSVDALTTTVNEELKPLVREMNSVLAEVRTVCQGVAENTDDVKSFMSALGETGNNLHTINSSVGAVVGMLNSANVWVSGVKVAAQYMLKRYLNRRRGE